MRDNINNNINKKPRLKEIYVSLRDLRFMKVSKYSYEYLERRRLQSIVQVFNLN